MTYSQAISYLFTSAPLFQNIGAGAYKEGLSTTHLLDQKHGHPHRAYRTIHVGGTNGKGSVSHTLAAILQNAGYKVGLFTSPHLTDFRERIRINGKMIPQQRVIDFVTQERDFFEPLHPSFFELTTALAFAYFQEEAVDVAVVEVGMGGRLDCTNIIQPDLSVITNISLDHTQFLGHTLAQIASEKAGIIKPHTPVIIGETSGHDDVRQVFLQKAETEHAPIIFADEKREIISSSPLSNGGRSYTTRQHGTLEGQLGGLCQEHNTATILAAVDQLQTLGYHISPEHIQAGMEQVCTLTGLQGRWQRLAEAPLTLCDTGHNVGGMQYITSQLASLPYKTLHIVIGMVNDKDIHSVLQLLPKHARYYFTQASVQRALPAEKLAAQAKELALEGDIFHSVKEAYDNAQKNAKKEDVIFIGGSTFVVADLLNSNF